MIYFSCDRLQKAKKVVIKMRKYLITLRKEKKLTQKQLAEKLDISESYYNQIENGERQKRMDITVIDRLSKALDISVNDIIHYESETEEKNT